MSKQILSALMFGHNRVRTLDEQPSLPFTLPDCGNTHWNRRPPTDGKRDIEENGCETFGLCDAYMVHRPHVCGPGPEFLIGGHECENSIGAMDYLGHVAPVHADPRTIEQTQYRLAIASRIRIQEEPGSILDGR